MSETPRTFQFRQYQEASIDPKDAEIERLQARVKVLEDGLRPFAVCADAMHSGRSSADELHVIPDDFWDDEITGDHVLFTIEAGAFFEARAALSHTSEGS